MLSWQLLLALPVSHPTALHHAPFQTLSAHTHTRIHSDNGVNRRSPLFQTQSPLTLLGVCNEQRPSTLSQVLALSARFSASPPALPFARLRVSQRQPRCLQMPSGDFSLCFSAVHLGRCHCTAYPDILPPLPTCKPSFPFLHVVSSPLRTALSASRCKADLQRQLIDCDHRCPLAY